MNTSILSGTGSRPGYGAIGMLAFMGLLAGMPEDVRAGPPVANVVHACARTDHVAIVDSATPCQAGETRIHLQPVTYGGSAGIGTASPAAALHVNAGDVLVQGGGLQFAHFNDPPVADLVMFRGGTPADGVFIAKRFAPDHTVFHINSPPESLGAREATLSLVRGDERNPPSASALELIDFYNNGYEVEKQFGMRMIKRGNGLDDTPGTADDPQFRDFVFDYVDPDNPAAGGEVMRITPPGDGDGTMRVTGYLQLDLADGVPPQADCDDPAEYGRLKVEPRKGRLYICSMRGWVAR